jgi:hypothetical protein
MDRDQHGGALAALAVVAVLVWLNQPTVVARTGFSPERYPTRAFETIARLPESSRIFASMQDGGYLCYRSNGTRKIWIDGRVDYFGPAPYRQFQQVAWTKPGWQATLREVGFTHAVVQIRYPVAAALEEAGWRPLYRDQRYVVLGRPVTPHWKVRNAFGCVDCPPTVSTTGWSPDRPEGTSTLTWNSPAYTSPAQDTVASTEPNFTLTLERSVTG